MITQELAVGLALLTVCVVVTGGVILTGYVIRQLAKRLVRD